MSASDARPADTPENYTLLAVLGERPQVMTELIWSLAQDGDVPGRIIVLTTARGERILRAQLLGDNSYRDFDNWGNRWTPFCQQVLERAPFDLEVEVPESDGTKIEDIYERTDAEVFENRCFDLVHCLTRNLDDPKLYGCIAGGRKTMAQDVTTAFTLYARGKDRLFHIIVSQYIEEKVPEFFWPRADRGHAKYAEDMHRVEKRFPHLRARLEDGLLSEVGGVDEDSHYQEILKALGPDRRALVTPRQVTLRMQKKTSTKGKEIDTKSGSMLIVKDASGNPMGRVGLTVENVATLLIIWHYLWNKGEQSKVAKSDLKMPWVDDARQRIYEAFGRSFESEDDDFVHWYSEKPYIGKSEYSTHISNLNKKLRSVTGLKRYLELTPASVSSDFEGEKPVKSFRRPLPEEIQLRIEVVPDEYEQLLRLTTEEGWPFKRLPLPEVVES